MYQLLSIFPKIKRWAFGHRPPAESQDDRGIDPATGSKMEKMPQLTSNEPSKVPYQLIRQITNNFGEELGRGTFGIVYKGVYEHGEEIAVKVLRDLLDDTEFQKEFNNLKGLKHENIVELVGFCNELEEEPAEFEGRKITAGRVRMALCFEYVQNGGLDKLISDQNKGLDWDKRYTIIKGVCEGLKYLHGKLEHPIIHLDLKPENILLDKNMVAKIADFGISKLIGEENTRKTMSSIGTLGYCPPEYIKYQIISEEFDIFSLGVLIVKIIVGPDNYLSIVDMTTRTAVRHVHEIWKTRLLQTTTQELLQVYCNQVKRCIGIALDCLKSNRQERPTIQKILSVLNETDIMTYQRGIYNEQVGQDDGDSSTLPSEVGRIAINSRPFARVYSELLYSEVAQLLRVQPQELFFPFISLLPRKKAMISCSLQLSNTEKDRIAFMLVANNPKRYLTKKPLFGVVPPSCVYTLSLAMPKQPRPTPSSSSADSGGDLFTLHCVPVSEYQLRDSDKDSLSIKYKELFEEFKKNAVASEEVHEVTLKASVCDRPASQGTSSFSEIITIPDAQQVSSIDVHPTEPWLMTTNHVGILRVWNYDTMTTLNSFDLVTYEPVRAAKFVEREKWVIAGDGNGCIHVYDYDQNQHVLSFDAHDSCITTLVVHPKQPFILSLSDDDDEPLIKLWNWEMGWACTHEFQGHHNKVTQVTFNPEDEDSFASASFDGTIKIWSISSNDPSNIITLKFEQQPASKGSPSVRESLLCVDYFTRKDTQHLIVGCKDRTAQIWKLGKKGCYDKLEGHADHISAVNLHLESQLLITGSLDGTICVWNSTTYKLENIMSFNLGAVYAFGCIKGSRRIVVGCHDGIAMMEISCLQNQIAGG